MDNSFPQQGSDSQQRGRFWLRMQMFDCIPIWLNRFIQLTQLTAEEQRDAGIQITQLTEEEQKDAGLNPESGA